MPLKEGDRVIYQPQREDWTYPSQSWNSIPPTGTKGTVRMPSVGASTTVWPGGQLGVLWDDGKNNTFPADYCILAGQRPPKRPARAKKKGTNAGRDTCFKCGKPTTLLQWGLPAADSQYCSYCKI